MAPDGAFIGEIGPHLAFCVLSPVCAYLAPPVLAPLGVDTFALCVVPPLPSK